MKKVLPIQKGVLALLLALGLGMGTAYAYTFGAVCSTGQVLYYNVTDATNHYVEITCPGTNTSNPWDGYTKPTGSITLPSTVTYIGVSYTVTAIGDNAFSGCRGLTGSLTIPNSVTSIGQRAFQNCVGFSGSLTIPDSVTTIGQEAFRSCVGFTGSLTIGNSVTTIGNSAFWGCTGFTGSLTLGSSLITIGSQAFYYCNGFTGSLTIPDSVTTIGNDAFNSCSSFTGTLTIGNSVTNINTRAFKDCNNLTAMMVLPEMPPTLGSTVFQNVPTTIPVAVPCGSLADYQTANGWSTFTNMQCRETITVSENGTATSSYVPVIGSYIYEYQRCQFIIPAERLQDMAQSYITEMSFYLYSPTTTAWTADFYVEIMEVEESYFIDNYFNITGLAQEGFTFYHGTLDATGSTMDIIADNSPYYYYGGNLLVSFNVTTPDTDYWKSATFWGERVSNTASLYAYNSNSSITTGVQTSFIPKTTFTFTPTSSCLRPTSFEADNITADGATLTWDGDSGSQYVVEWKKASDETWNSTTHTGTTYTLSSLEPNTNYNVRVRKVCSGASLSNWHTISFTTACTVHSLPYTYGFEDESDMDCWSMVDCHSYTGRCEYSSAYEGNYCFRFYYNTNPPQYLISPEIVGTTGIEVSFYYKNYNNDYPETFQVGYSTTTNNANAFIWGDEVTANDKDTWQLYEGIFPSSTKYVAIKYTSNDQYYLYLDDFNLFPSTCPKPTQVTASNVTSTSATLSWHENGDATTWQICLNGDETNLIDANENFYTLLNLNSHTTYTAKVRSVCGDGQYTNWSGEISFTTACTVHSLPYTYGFEDESDMDCWSMVDCHSSTGRYRSSFSAYEGNYCFRFYYSSNPPQYLISPEFDGTAGMEMSFYYKNYNNYPETFQVGYSTTTNTPNAFTWGDEVTANTGAWQLFEGDFPVGTKYVAIKYTSNDQSFLYLDDFNLFPSTCPKPTQVTASNVTSTSATLSWHENGDATTWQICLNGDETNLIDANENFYTLLNLNSHTTYTAKVRSVCGDGQYTDWSDEIDFTTGCASFGLPYTYGFEDESDMDCWSMVDCHSSTGRTSYAYHEGERSFRFYYSSNPPQYLISPKFEGTSAMEVSFYYRNQSNSYPETFQVGYSTTTNNPSAFTWGDEVTANDKDTWMLHEDIFPVGTKYVAVKYTSDDQYCLFLDDFSFTDAGACPKPKVTLDEVTPTSVTFSWENAEWCYLYLYQGTTLVHNTLTRINPYTIEGLTLGTDYRLEVMASCEQGISNPTIANFTTPDFAPDGWIAFQDWTLLNGLCTNAWAYSNNSIYSPFISNDGGTTNAYSTGEASMVYATKLYAFEDAQYHFVTCWKGQGERNYDYLRIALVPATETLTPGTVPSGFSYNSLPEGWIALDGGNQLCLSTADDDMYGERAEVNIDVAAGNYYVVFAWRNDTDSGTQPPASITRMYIGREACATPTALAVTDITTSSATISWKVYEGQNAWEILYKTDDDPDYLWGVETNENPYVFEGYPSHPLQPGTHYTVKIRALCGDDEVGYWSDEIDFFTDVCEAEDKCEITFELTDSYGDGWNGAYIEVVDAATGVVVGTVTNENLNGTTGFGTNEVNIKTLAVCDGRELQFVWHSGSYDSECSYTIYGADAYPYITGSGAMSETASFTVDCSMSGCRKPTDVTILSTAPNDAVVGWTENGTSESWYVFYGTEEGSFNNYFEVYENPVYLSYYYDEELEPATTYYLFVTPSCAVQYDDPINSYSSDEVVFTTMEACPVPFNLSAEPIGGGAKLRWTGYSDSYNVRYRQVGETGWTTTTSGYWLELNYLESVTTYEFQVQGVCDGVTTDWSETVTFTTKMLRQTVDDGDWNVATNWEPVGVPSIEEDVILNHNMTIPAGEVAEANKIEGAWGALIIEDGGQLVHNSNGSNAPAIFMEKNITGYGSGNGHWYLITNPNSWNSLNPASYGLTSGNYDLYKFDYAGSDKKEWRNYKTTAFSLDTYNSGYLYAHETDVVLELQLGSYRPSSDRRSKSLRYTTGDYEFPGWHLIGNPFLCNAYLVNSSGTALPYYRMNAAGTDLEAVTSGAIAPLEGIFHNVTSTGYVYFTREVPVRGSSLSLVVSGPSTGSTTVEVDNAIISFGEGEGLEKFNFREGGSKLCIPRGGKDYAVMSVDGDAARHVSTEMPVSFKAEQDGTYTLSFSSEEVTFSYLHLIDNSTGADIDLLALTPEAVIAGVDPQSHTASYTFTAKTTDNVNRFKLVFTIQK